MKKNILTQLFTIGASLAALYGCSGDPAFSVNTLQLGSGVGPNFTAEEIEILITDLPTANDATDINAYIVDADGAFSTEAVTVSFSSRCILSGDSTINPASVTNSTGVVSTIYTNISCTGTDEILASTNSTPPLLAAGSVTTGATTPPVVITPGTTLQLGSYSGITFTPNAVALGNTSIIPGGNTTVTVSIVDDTSQFSTDAIDVTFSSLCSNTGDASFSATTVTNTTGTVQVTYTDGNTGCGNDTIFANATLTGATTSSQAIAALTISATVVPPVASGTLSIGNGSGSGFANAVHITTPSLAPLGSTNVTANIVDEDNSLVSSSQTVNFEAYCVDGNVTIAPASVTASNGIFTTTLTDVSCNGDVNIIAYSTLNSVRKNAYGRAIVNDTSTPITQIGRDTLANFVINEIGVDGDTQDTGALSAGDTATLSVTIVDGSGNLIPASTTVSFTSDCFSQGLADIYDAPGGSNSVTTTSGRATVTYQAQGCAIADNITASSSVGTATGTITVTPANVSSIQFISATPSQIAIRGMSSASVGETSTVSFKIVDTTGGAIPNHPVTFTLSNTDGGIEFGDTGTSTSTGTSDINGNISTVVKSGTTKASFRVLVTSDVDTSIVGQSDPILVSTGIADQNSMSLSASVLNPEGLSHDGETSVITARASDRYNNPVPDNTVIGFIAEGGSIQSSCLTTDGSCTVTWTSSNPRPSLAYTSSTNLDVGQATILAFVVGEESFTDANGNGQFDAGEPFDDMPEAFLDVDGNGTRGDGTGGTPVEIYQDYNNSSTYNGISSNFNGVLCNSGCGGDTGIHARDDLTLIMSGSTANITFVSEPTGTKLQACNIDFSYTVTDINGNIMPSGTLIKVTTTTGSITTGGSRTVTNASPTTAAAINTSGRGFFTGQLKTGTTDATNLNLTVEVTTPNGIVTEESSTSFNVNNTGGVCP